MYSTQQLIKAGVLLTAIAASSQAFAAPVGRVLFTSGEVRIITADGSSRIAKRGDTVQSGERIQTATGALGQVQMNDGARVAVRSDSRLRFDVPSTQAKAAQLSLESGNVRVLNIAAKGEAAIPPLEVKTAEGNVLMQQADAVVANVKSGEGAGGEQNLIVRVDQGTGQLSTTASAERTTLSTGNAVAINAGRVEQFTGNLGSTAQVPVSTTAVRRPTNTAIAAVVPLKPPAAPPLRPRGIIPRPLPTLPRSPLRPVSPLVPPTQISIVLDRNKPDNGPNIGVLIDTQTRTGPIDAAPVFRTLGSLATGQNFEVARGVVIVAPNSQPISITPRPTSGTSANSGVFAMPNTTLTNGGTSVPGTLLTNGQTTITPTPIGTRSGDLTFRVSTSPTLIRR